MVGYLNITDDGLLSANTEKAIAQSFLRRSEYAPGGGGEGEPLPLHFSGVTPEHAWTAPVYNQGSPSLSLIRGGIVHSKHVGADYEIVVLGDSKTEGYNAGSPRWRWGWVGILRDMLGAVEGTIPAFPTSVDPRWAVVNMKLGTSAELGLRPDAPGAWEATFTQHIENTGGSFFIHADTATTVTVSVDGGAPQSFPITAVGFQEVTPTGVTGSGTHSYKIAGTTSDVWLSAFRPTYDGPRLKVTNLGRSGGTASYWRAGYKANGAGLWDVFAAGTAPDAVMCALGTNQPSMDGPLNATNLTALWAEIAALGKPAVIITPGGLDLTGTESWFEQYRAQLDAADTHNLALVDFASVIGTGADAQARGLMADTAHENRKGMAYEAAAVHHLLT